MGDSHTKDSTSSHWWRRRRSTGGPDGPPPFRRLDVAMLAIGGLSVVTGLIVTSVAAPADPFVSQVTQYPTVSLTALLQAADSHQVAAVQIPSTSAPAVAVLSTPVPSGQLAQEASPAKLLAGSALNVFVPSSVASMTAEQLTADGVTVWMGAAPADFVPDQATLGTASAGSSAASQGSPSWSVVGRLMLILGSLLALIGGIRLALFRRLRRTDPVAATQAVSGSAAAASLAVAEVPATRFADVAGADEAVDSLREMVDFLKDADKYKALGAKLPKGALLVGPPGTGKTLLARAVAGEAGVPFFSAAGSDFVEKYVGVGAQRVRALFKQARAAGKAIIFIDEIDAVARRRSDDGGSGGQAESENTLISLLNEMDGFSSSDVVVLAATNRADILDPALTRPGRLDRRVEVPLPDRRGREHILGVHVRGVKLDEDVDLELFARRTPGFSGAQLEAVVNEAALEAVRAGHSTVQSIDFDQAIAIVAMGRARTSALVTDTDRLITAWHEAGHTLCALLLEDADEPTQVSIVPRGPAGGVTWMAGTDDQFLSRAKAHARLVVALGGRAAEQLLLGGEFTQGASGDLQSATETALMMTTRYGMTRLGLASRAGSHLGGTSSKEVTEVVEELLAQAHEEATKLISEHRLLLEAIAAELLDCEDLDARDLARIAAECGVSPASHPTPVPQVPVPSAHRRLESEPAPAAAPVPSSLPPARQPRQPLSQRVRTAAEAARDAFKRTAGA